MLGAARMVGTAVPNAAPVLSISSYSQESVNLSWTYSAAPDSYKVYKDSSLYTTTASTSQTVSGLKPNTSYSFYVVPVFGTTNGTASNVKTQQTANVNISLSVSAIGSTTCSLTWSVDNTTAYTYLNLMWLPGNDVSGGWRQYSNESPSSSGISIVGLLPSTQYWFYLQASDSSTATGDVYGTSTTVTFTTNS